MRLGIIITILLMNTELWALTPLDGLLMGDVKEVKQFDPLSNVFNQSYEEEKSVKDLKYHSQYFGIYRQGKHLKNSCEVRNDFRYTTYWEEQVAKRTVVSTLQYVGLDLTTKAIAKYAQTLELTESSYENLVNNLVDNYCSKNITVYSLKLIKNNLMNLFQSENKFQLPTLTHGSYYSDVLKDMTSSKESREKEMNMTLHNFRALCSWSGNVEDYRLLVPLLQNPFVMSIVYDHLLGQKVAWDSKMERIVHVASSETVQMKCENYICRRQSYDDKKRLEIPRIIGSTSVEQDFRTLYCGHFSEIDYKLKFQNPHVAKWVRKQTVDTPALMVNQFISLYTGTSDLMLSANSFNKLSSVLKENINFRWDRWADTQMKKYAFDNMYEESLNIDLVPSREYSKIAQRQFSLTFDVTLGEYDKSLDGVDKISANFNLKLSKKFLRWMRSNWIQLNNYSNFEAQAEFVKTVAKHINLQLEEKKKYFLIPLWDEGLDQMIVTELMEQLEQYHGYYFNDFKHEEILIPVKFRYGLFALHYMNEKFKMTYRVSKTEKSAYLDSK